MNWEKAREEFVYFKNENFKLSEMVAGFSSLWRGDNQEIDSFSVIPKSDHNIEDIKRQLRNYPVPVYIHSRTIPYFYIKAQR